MRRQRVRDGVWLVTGPGGRSMTCSPAIAETTANELRMVKEMTEDIRLVVLDMAGATTVADGGLVEQAFAVAAEELGVEPGSADHAEKLDHVRPPWASQDLRLPAPVRRVSLARRANAAFEKAYGELVDGGRLAPISQGRARRSRSSGPAAAPSS